MPYLRDFTINVGAAGLTVKGVLRASDGTLHGTFRDVAWSAVGGGVYHLSTAALPDGFRGALVAYAGALGAATTLAGVSVLAGLAANPEEFEAIADIKEKTDAITGDVTIASPVDVLAPDRTLSLIAGDGYESGTRVPKWAIENYAGPNLAGATGKLRFTDYPAYTTGATAPAALVADAAVAVAGTTVTITAPLHEDQTAQLRTPPPTGRPTHMYQLIVTTAAGEDVTILIARCLVTRRIDPAA